MSNASVQVPLGTPAPEFSLPDVITGETCSLSDFEGKNALLVIFVCRHCPYVQHVKEELARLGDDYQPRGVGIVAISSNDAVAYPDDSPESLAEFARDTGFPFPLVYDESQSVARAYSAACTPDFFVYDSSRRLVYRGRLDSSRPNSGIPVTGVEIRAALDATLAGQPVNADQYPSIGCSIKWKG